MFFPGISFVPTISSTYEPTTHMIGRRITPTIAAVANPPKPSRLKYASDARADEIAPPMTIIAACDVAVASCSTSSNVAACRRRAPITRF